MQLRFVLRRKCANYRRGGRRAPILHMKAKANSTTAGDDPPDLRNFLDVSPAVFWSTDADGCIVLADAGVAHRLGMPRRFASSEAHRSCIHPDDLGVVTTEIARVRATGAMLDTECRARLGDKPYRWIRIRARFDGASQRWFGSTEDVHDRREAQAAARVASERLASALDGGDAWAWDYDVQAGSFWYSDRWRALLGYDPSDIANDLSDVDRLMHPDDIAATSRALRAHLAGHSDVYEAEFRLRKKDGGWAWLHDRGRVVERDGDGRALRAIGTRTDISARKAAEAQTRAQAGYLKTLLDNITDSVIAVEPGGRGFYNKAYAKLFLDGMECNDWRDLTEILFVFDIVDADGHPVAEERRPIRRILGGESVEECEISATVRSSGRVFRLVYNGQPVRGADGSVELAVLTLRDATEHYRTLDALRASEARLEAIIESLEEGVVAYAPGDPNGGFVNSAFRRMVAPDDPQRRVFKQVEEGLAAFELIDNDGNLLTPEQRPMPRLLRGERIEHLAARVRFHDGREMDVVCRGEQVIDADGKVKLAILAVRDVTRQHKAEADLAKLQQQLIHVSRVSAMGTMAGSLAHELNQPLAAVANYAAAAKMMLARPKPPLAKVSDALGRVTGEAVRAGQIVNSLRRFITKGEVDRQPASLAAIVREALAIAHNAASAEGLHVKLKLDPRADAVVVDRIQMQQVIFNLVRNAVEAMVGASNGELTIASRTAGEQIELLLADHGPGLPLEVEQHLFEPFVTTKENGMGIGLPICRSIMRAHGGDIRAEARPTGGTVFILTLPRAGAGAE